MSGLADVAVDKAVPVEVQLSCMLSQDAADIERPWQQLSAMREEVIADASDTLLDSLLGEIDALAASAIAPMRSAAGEAAEPQLAAAAVSESARQ